LEEGIEENLMKMGEEVTRFIRSYRAFWTYMHCRVIFTIFLVSTYNEILSKLSFKFKSKNLSKNFKVGHPDNPQKTYKMPNAKQKREKEN
jgi:hypothetical protein